MIFDRLRVLCCAGLILLTVPVHAGLVLEIDPGIDLSGVDALVAQDGDLIVESRNGSTTISLPENALPLVAQWATRYAGGPLVYSIELASVSSISNRYAPPNTPPGLVSAMFLYDAYHSQFSCGALPEPPKEHPLVTLHGDTSALPSARLTSLLDPENDSHQAVWYRRLAERYTAEPECPGGQLSLSVHPSSDGDLPVRLEAWSHRYVRVESWLRQIEVMPVVDRIAAELPYEPLRRDIATRWDAYRAVFEPFEEVSAIAEALAILHHAHAGHPELWKPFVESLLDGRVGYTPDAVDPSSQPYFQFDDLTWADLERASRWSGIGEAVVREGVHTTAQAELAMAWYAQHLADDPLELGQRIETWLSRDDRLQARWILAQLQARFPFGLTDSDAERDGEVFAWVDAFFELTRASRYFVDRLDGLRHIEDLVSREDVYDSLFGDEEESDETPTTTALRQRLVEERAEVIEDFREHVSPLCLATAGDGEEPDLAVWEGLTRVVYMTQFMDLASADGLIDPEIARLVACIHHRRALAPHVGRDVFYRHAHFRFLGYLAERRPDDLELAEIVLGYQADIADRLGMGAWREEERLAYYEAPGEDSSVDSVARTDSLSTIEGNWVPTSCLVNELGDSSCDDTERRDHGPAAVVSENGEVSVLLVDSRVLADALAGTCARSDTASSRIRVRGLALDRGRSLIPYQAEARCSETWHVVDLPHTGTTGH